MLAFLPAATVARAVPAARLWSAPAGRIVHLGRPDGDAHAARCRVFTRPLEPADLDGPARQVCVTCARRLPQTTRMHLATLGRPTLAELGALREAEALRAATHCAAVLEHHRTEAVLEGSVSQRVVFDGDPPAAFDYNGTRPDGVPLTVGLMIGALIPGSMTGGRLWLPGTATSAARTTSPGGSGSDTVLAPRGPVELERYRASSGPRYGTGSR